MTYGSLEEGKVEIMRPESAATFIPVVLRESLRVVLKRSTALFVFLASIFPLKHLL